MASGNQSIQDKVYYTLRKYILNFTFAPGTVISTQEVANQLRVSRTPAREAFIRLQKDGLIQILPQRETMISLIDMDRVGQERFMRMNLEQAAIREFLQKAESCHFQKLNALIEKQLIASVENRYEDLLRYDDEFHCVLFEGAKQGLAWELLSRSNTHYQRVRLLSLNHEDISEKIVIQHQELLRALEDRQMNLVLDLHHKHLTKLDLEEDTLRQNNPEYFLEEQDIEFFGLWGESV